MYKEKAVKSGLFDKLKNSAFKGSAIDLVMHALGDGNPDKDELEKLENFLEEYKKNKK